MWPTRAASGSRANTAEATGRTGGLEAVGPRGVADGVGDGVGDGDGVAVVGDDAAAEGGGAAGAPLHADAPSATTAATAARPRTPRRYGTSTRRPAARLRAGIGSRR